MEYKKITLIIIANNNIEKCLENISKQSYIKDIEIMFLYKKENEDNINNLKQKYNEQTEAKSKENKQETKTTEDKQTTSQSTKQGQSEGTEKQENEQEKQN